MTKTTRTNTSTLNNVRKQAHEAGRRELAQQIMGSMEREHKRLEQLHATLRAFEYIHCSAKPMLRELREGMEALSVWLNTYRDVVEEAGPF